MSIVLISLILLIFFAVTKYLEYGYDLLKQRINQLENDQNSDLSRLWRFHRAKNILEFYTFENSVIINGYISDPALRMAIEELMRYGPTSAYTAHKYVINKARRLAGETPPERFLSEGIYYKKQKT